MNKISTKINKEDIKCESICLYETFKNSVVSMLLVILAFDGA